MLADFGSRSAYSLSDKNFNPYFQYKTGPYQPDQFLYFLKQPEYAGYGIVQYLEFHYEEYPDKSEFLRFLSSEVSQLRN